MKSTVVVVDDFTTTRAGLRSVIESDRAFEVVGEAADGDEAVKLVGRVQPHVVVLDLGLPGMPGTEVIRRVRCHSPGTRIVIQTMHADEDTAVTCLRSGADAYVLKQDASDILLEALHAALEGLRFISPSFTKTGIANAERRAAAGDEEWFAALTVREFEVLRLVAQGLTSRETASRLRISPRTVDSHRASLMAKLGLRSQRELVRYAFQRGILT